MQKVRFDSNLVCQHAWQKWNERHLPHHQRTVTSSASVCRQDSVYTAIPLTSSLEFDHRSFLRPKSHQIIITMVIFTFTFKYHQLLISALYPIIIATNCRSCEEIKEKRKILPDFTRSCSWVSEESQCPIQSAFYENAPLSWKKISALKKLAFSDDKSTYSHTLFIDGFLRL